MTGRVFTPGAGKRTGFHTKSRETDGFPHQEGGNGTDFHEDGDGFPHQGERVCTPEAGKRAGFHTSKGEPTGFHTRGKDTGRVSTPGNGFSHQAQRVSTPGVRKKNSWLPWGRERERINRDALTRLKSPRGVGGFRARSRFESKSRCRSGSGPGSRCRCSWSDS